MVKNNLFMNGFVVVLIILFIGASVITVIGSVSYKIKNTMPEEEPPTSAVDPLPLWMKSVPFTVTAIAFDNTSVANVTLYYRHTVDCINWTNWTSYGTDTGAPWQWQFTGIDGYYEFYSIAIDDYGNVENPPEIADASCGLDTEAPVTTCILDGTLGGDGWYVSVTVTLSASDNTSGIESTWYKIDAGYWKFYVTPFTFSDDGEHKVYYYSFDTAGNQESVKSVEIKIDKTPPVTDHEFDGIIGDESWFIGNVTVTLSAEDMFSGVNYTMYKLDDTEWQEYMGSFLITEDGNHSLYYYSVDKVGNEETIKEGALKIDQTDPKISLTVEKAGRIKWLLKANVSDETSGIAKVEFYVDGEFEGEVIEAPYEWMYFGTGNKAQAIVYDNAGNEAISEEVDAVPQSHQRQSSSSQLPITLWPFP